MNLASWIILAIVIAILALAVKATFFKGKRRGGCCDVGDASDSRQRASSEAGAYHGPGLDGASVDALSCAGCSSARCGGCDACEGSAVARNALKPIVRPE